MPNLINCSSFLDQHQGFQLLDVRSEVEFAKGHIPGALNCPILTTDERHQVGICYREKGRDSAIELGQALTNQVKKKRVSTWLEGVKAKNFIITCYRGGLRSRYAQVWLMESGISAPRLEGGYKAFRKHMALQLAAPRQGWVLGGLTGSGKTTFLRELGGPLALDLEGLANHRGSAFGSLFLGAQPSQQTFENALGLWLHHNTHGVLAESESRLIGKLVIPESFFSQLQKFPRINLEISLQERVQNIFQEYVAIPSRSLTKEQIHLELENTLQQIKNRLGGETYIRISRELGRSFAKQNLRASDHEGWISQLLVDYYDRLYLYSMKRSEGKTLYQGNKAGCLEFVRKSLDPLIWNLSHLSEPASV